MAGEDGEGGLSGRPEEREEGGMGTRRPRAEVEGSCSSVECRG